MIHAFSMNGYFVVVDGNSGSVHVVDEMVFEILKNSEAMPELPVLQRQFGERYRAEEISEVFQEIKGLVEQRCLYTDMGALEETAKGKAVNKSVKALCLNVAHDCNLRCAYCFASEGDYQSGRELMSEEVALGAVDYLVEHSDGRTMLEIDFFGGEPMMNFEVVKRTVAYAKTIEKKSGKRFHFTITTNGTLLDSKTTAYINEFMDNVVISIDGRKEIHDAVRYDRAKNGSYDRIVPAAQALVAARGGKSYFVRGTFTAKNKDFSADVMHLADLGFNEVSVEPVVGSGSALYLTEPDIPEVLQEYENLAVKYIERIQKEPDFRYYHFSINTYNGPCLYKRLVACGAGSEYIAVAPDGKLYPCHQFVGLPEFVIGDIRTGIRDIELQEQFNANNVLSKEKCRDCWAKLYCSGGCHAHAYFANGSITQPDELSCTLQKKRIECALMIQAWRSEQGEKPKSVQQSIPGRDRIPCL